jgi:hypothetical protein
MATTTNYGWGTPDDTDLVKDGALAIRDLGQDIDTTTKDLNPETTTGDIAYRSATANTNTRLGIGTAGQVLTVNSGATAPEWATPAAGGGKILQVVSTTKLDTYSSSIAAGAFSSNVTGLEATITPSSASSKILVFVSVHGSQSVAFGMTGFRLMRDATAISIANTASSRARATAFAGARGLEGNDISEAVTQFLDEPATTSSITYGVQLYNTAGTTETVYVNRSNTDTDAVNIPRLTSSITIMEVGA